MSRRTALWGVAAAVVIALLTGLLSPPEPSTETAAVFPSLNPPMPVEAAAALIPSTTTTVPPPPAEHAPRPAVSRSAPTPRRTPPTTVAPPAPPATAAPPVASSTASVSWYAVSKGAGACGAPCAFRYPYTFAHRSMPFGTAVTFCKDGRCVVAYCADRGPYIAGRTFDLSEQTAAAVDPLYRSHGVFTVSWAYS